jgi:hypothetical protein
MARERQAPGPIVAVRRAGRGRVAAIGYDETWRWRMEGGEAGEAAHRAWWSRMVGLVAPARAASVPRVVAAHDDPVPRAALVGALGAPSDVGITRESHVSNRLALTLLVLAFAALLAETASRRFRGAS